jgi:hypothetical protein
MQSELDILCDVSRLLNGAKIPCMVAGSIAMAYHGYVRATRDVDIVIQLLPIGLKRFVSSFGHPYGADLEVISSLEHQQVFHLIHCEAVVKVD